MPFSLCVPHLFRQEDVLGRLLPSSHGERHRPRAPGGLGGRAPCAEPALPRRGAGRAAGPGGRRAALGGRTAGVVTGGGLMMESVGKRKHSGCIFV